MEVNGVGSGRMSELLVKMLVFRKCHFRSDPISQMKSGKVLGENVKERGMAASSENVQKKS